MGLLARQSKSVGAGVIAGTARVDRRTKDLVRRLKPGEIAVVHHEDMDALAARALVDAGAAAVLNAASSSTGRYPNTGPTILLNARIPLIDDLGEEAFRSLSEGQSLRVKGNVVEWDGGSAKGRLVTPDDARVKLELGQENVGRELAAFAQNTLERLNTEWRLFFEPFAAPELKTPIRGRHVVVVVRGPDYERDLAAIRNYIREVRPVMIAVDGAADKLLQFGMKPDIILGDMDSVSNQALKLGAELIVHGYTDPKRPSPGVERCEKMNLETKVIRAPGTSEDLALLLAHELGAELIVSVGSHFSLEEFLDKGRAGMSSTFLTRLKTGSKLVDAKGAGRLYASRMSPWDFVWLVGAALLMVSVAALLTPMGQTIIDTIRTWMKLSFR